MMRFELDLLNSSGVKYGRGPSQSVRQWRYTARLNRAGEIAFTMDGADDLAAHLANRRYARAMAHLDGEWVEVGHGRIDDTSTTPQAGQVARGAAGLDLIGELRDRRVGDLILAADSAAVAIADALSDIAAFAPPGWTISVDPADTAAMAAVQTYGRFAGESVLGALVMLAEHTQSYFYRGAGRTLYFRRTWEESGIRAVQANGQLGPGQCAITSLSRRVDTHELLTRIVPFGSGNGQIRLTLAATSRSAPAGYTLDAAANYIERDEAVDDFGVVDFPEIEFKEIGPVSNTDADLETAADVLFDSALEELRRRSTLADQETYTLTVAGCEQLLRPLQTIRLVYYDPERNIDIDRDLYILEATWQADGNAIRTTGLVVSTDTRWPESDESAAAERASQGRIYMAHPQLGPNAPVYCYTKHLDEDEVAKFRFRFGDEIATIQRVLFDFQILPLESTTKAVSGPVDFEVDIDVEVEGTIDISHDHPIPDHQHSITVAGSGTAEAMLVDNAGGFGFLQKASAGDVLVNTNVDTGATTSESGGSPTLSLEGSGSGTGTIDLSGAFTVDYGVFREDGANTYAIGDLEYRVNGGSWADLNTATLLPDGWYQLDLSGQLIQSGIYRPIQSGNLLEIQAKTTGKSAMIEAQLQPRSTIQSILYS